MNQVEPIYDKKYECIICNGSFTTKKFRSRFIKVTSYDTDFCPNYSSEDLNPILYNVNVCPHCGYSSTDDFMPYFPPEAIRDIHAKVCEQWVPHDFGQKRTISSALKTYKLAAYCGSLKKEKHITLAGIYARLAWLYRIDKNNDQEQRFLKLAANEYLQSYMTDDFKGTQVSEVKLLYLIGELSRRTHQIDQAKQFFSKVMERQDQTEARIVEMTRERWHEIREAQKTEKETQKI